MLTITCMLGLAAFIGTLLGAIAPPKCPLWVPVLLLCICELLRCVPLR